MSRQWEPGDVAIIRVGTAEWEFAIRRGDGSWACQHTRDGAVEGQRIDARPLVVIDPEDRDKVRRLRQLFRDLGGHTPGHDGTEAMQQALRWLSDSKPEEPTGLGAVVVDQNDITYVMASRLVPSGLPMLNNWRTIDGPRCGTWNMWDQIDVKEILSEGVTE